MQYHAIQCNTMQYHGMPCNTMECHTIPYNTMQYGGAPHPFARTDIFHLLWWISYYQYRSEKSWIWKLEIKIILTSHELELAAVSIWGRIFSAWSNFFPPFASQMPTEPWIFLKLMSVPMWMVSHNRIFRMYIFKWVSSASNYFKHWKFTFLDLDSRHLGNTKHPRV